VDADTAAKLAGRTRTPGRPRDRPAQRGQGRHRAPRRCGGGQSRARRPRTGRARAGAGPAVRPADGGRPRPGAGPGVRRAGRPPRGPRPRCSTSPAASASAISRSWSAQASSCPAGDRVGRAVRPGRPARPAVPAVRRPVHRQRTIAFALANELPGAVVHAVERDPDALAWTRRNAALRVAAGDPEVQLHLGSAEDALPGFDGRWTWSSATRRTSPRPRRTSRTPRSSTTTPASRCGPARTGWTSSGWSSRRPAGCSSRRAAGRRALRPPGPQRSRAARGGRRLVRGRRPPGLRRPRPLRHRPMEARMIVDVTTDSADGVARAVRALRRGELVVLPDRHGLRHRGGRLLPARGRRPAGRQGARARHARPRAGRLLARARRPGAGGHARPCAGWSRRSGRAR
jgi:hypothetical protein